MRIIDFIKHATLELITEDASYYKLASGECVRITWEFNSYYCEFVPYIGY